MTKKIGVFELDDVNVQVSLNPTVKKEEMTLNEIVKSTTDIRKTTNTERVSIENALKIVNRQMEMSGLRPRTIKEYNYTFNRFVTAFNFVYIDEITVDKIYEWLHLLGNISNFSKLNRLKSLTALFNRFYENGWYDKKFWKDVKIKVDKKLKEAANEKDLNILLSLLDTSTFVGFRDTVAILVLYRTGIRITTLALLEERHLDFATNTLTLTGDIQKNHQVLKLPIDDELSELLQRLIKQNNLIRKHYKTNNKYIFITNRGNTVIENSNGNAISKQLGKYARKYGLKGINPHALRRSYATNLLKKNVSVALISRALGHSDLGTTTRYLDIDIDTVAESLRDYL